MKQELFLVLVSAVYVSCFSKGAPNYSCKDPSVFHTQKLNSTHEGIIMPQEMETSPFIVEANVTRFEPGQHVEVSMFTEDPSKPMVGFFLQAIQANISMQDLRRRAFGSFINLTKDERPSVCQSHSNEAVGGATHTSSKPQEIVRVIWISPKHHNPGNIQFLATGVLDYTTYWIDVRSPVLVPSGYPTKTDADASLSTLTPTAAWYRWLQYLTYQNSQSVPRDNSLPGNAQNVPRDNSLPGNSQSVPRNNSLPGNSQSVPRDNGDSGNSQSVPRGNSLPKNYKHSQNGNSLSKPTKQ